MKIARVMSIVLFVLALSAFIFYTFYSRQTSDFSAPVISAESDTITAPVNVTDEELLAGMKAIDNLNGDVTNTLVVASLSKFVKKNTRNVTYAAFDQNNNVGKYTRELTYTDYVPPRFVLRAPLHFHQNDSFDNNEVSSLIKVEDMLDGDISEQIIMTSGDRYTYDEDSERQTIDVQVSNRAGDTASLELEVQYLSYAAFNRQAPDLQDYILYTVAGRMPDFRENIKGVRSGTSTALLPDTHFDLLSDFRIDTSNVDFNTPGVYTVIYFLSTDESGERQQLGSAEMILVVEEP